MSTTTYNLIDAVDQKQVADIIRGYITAALWSSSDEEGTPLDSYCDGDNLTEEARAKIAEEVTAFLRSNRADIEGFKQATSVTDEHIGHDLWLTRNNHGTGFWDRKDGGEYGQRLTKAAHAMGERHLMVARVLLCHE